MEGDEPMEVDKQQEEANQTTSSEQALMTGADPAVPPTDDEGGFILEPVDITSAIDTTTKAKKRKRRLVVDTEIEFTSKSIRSQLEDYTDILQQKLFPPPTKKAMLWKDMTTCEQLFVRPVFPFIAQEIIRVVARNYTSEIPGEVPEESIVDLEQDGGVVDVTRDTTMGEIEKARVGGEPGESAAETTIDQTGIGVDGTSTVAPPDDRELALEDGTRAFDQEGGEFPPQDGVTGQDEQELSRVIPEMPELEGISSEEANGSQAVSEKQQTEEMSEEFEKRRWTKRTQQVLRMLDRNFNANSQTPFSALTQKCNRKQAASRFYTCLLLAKENTIQVQQSRAYGEILITKGPKFTKAF